MICRRPEFCELAGITNANLSTYIKRGKIVLEPDGKTINTEKRENADFLKGRNSEGKGKFAQPKPETTEAVIPSVNVLQNTPSKKVVNAAERATISKYNLELEKMQAELDKKIVDTKLAEQKLATLLGNNIPIDVVKSIVAQLSKSIINNYKSFSEQQITEICHVHRIAEADRVKIIAKNTTGLNNIHSKAVTDARVQIKNAIGTTKSLELNDDEDGI